MENKKFTKADLKPGYVVELRNEEFRIIMEVGRQGAYIATDGKHKWNYTSAWNDDFNKIFNERDRSSNRDEDIVRIYGFVKTPEFYSYVGDISSAFRPLLWQRSEPKKMTVSEISKALGYEVEIVAETSKGE
jgi:hypothetical protein